MRALNRAGIVNHSRLPLRLMSTKYSQLLALGAVLVLAAACTRKSVDKEEAAARNDTTHISRQTQTTSTTDANGPAMVNSETTLTIQDVRAPNPRAALTCAPTRFGLGDTLTLRMRTPHGHYLWVTRSDQISYLIVYPAQGELKAAYSLVPSDEFASVATIQLPSQIQAIPYVYGRDTIREPVFSEPGDYLLQVGDNFATDGGVPPSTCHLTFVRRASK